MSERRIDLLAIQKKISRENLRAKYLRGEASAHKEDGKAAARLPHSKQAFMALIEGPSKDNQLVWEERLEVMTQIIVGKIYLTDIEFPSGEIADTGNVSSE